VLGQSITGANEIVTILFIYTTAIGAAVSIGKHEHIGIDVFVNIVPPRFYKTIRILQIILLFSLHLILFIYCLGWVNKAGGYLMPATGLPRLVAIASVPLGCVLCILYCIKILIDIIDPSSVEKR
jgi:TRAP-type C4-dicarboxylate transport system permease small subunit